MDQEFNTPAELLSVGINSTCADCWDALNESNAWFSQDFFVFLCPRCADIHHQKGISACKLLSTVDNGDMLGLVGRGNAQFNAEYEASLAADFERHGVDDAAAAQFIHSKYELQSYRVVEPTSPIHPKLLSASLVASPLAPVTTEAADMPPSLHPLTPSAFRTTSANTDLATWYETKASEAAQQLLTSDDPSSLVCVMVVGFDERRGNVVEWIYPAAEVLPHEFDHVPFLALPDGAHLSDEDSTYFVLPPLSADSCITFGVSCFKQIHDADAVRGRVQKAVCVISRAPLWGAIHIRLQAATRAFFLQGNFADFSVLIGTYESLQQSLSVPIDASSLYMGLSPCLVLQKFRRQTILLFKALLLERRVLLVGVPASQAVSCVLALLSMLPGQLESLVPTAFRAAELAHAPSHCLMVFGSASEPARQGSDIPLFQPYMAVPQLPDLRDLVTPGVSHGSGFLIGASNALFAHEPSHLVEVLGSLASKRVVIQEKALSPILTMTSADVSFMDWVLAAVDKRLESDISWIGSDGWVLAQFRRYCEGLKEVAIASALTGELTGGGQGYGELFIGAWRGTRNYRVYVRDELARRRSVLDSMVLDPVEKSVEKEEEKDHTGSVKVVRHPGRDVDTLEHLRVQLGPALVAADRLRAQADTQLRAFGGTMEKAWGDLGERMSKASKDMKGSVLGLREKMEKLVAVQGNGKNGDGVKKGRKIEEAEKSEDPSLNKRSASQSRSFFTSFSSNVKSNLHSLFGRSRSGPAPQPVRADPPVGMERKASSPVAAVEEKPVMVQEKDASEPSVGSFDLSEAEFHSVDPSAFVIDDSDEEDGGDEAVEIKEKVEVSASFREDVPVAEPDAVDDSLLMPEEEAGLDPLRQALTGFEEQSPG